MQLAQDKLTTRNGDLLAVSLELAKNSWKVALHDGKREHPAVFPVTTERPSDRVATVVALIEQTRRAWKLSSLTEVFICYEAGQESFWPQRAFSAYGYRVLPIDPASIEVARHAKRAKTDRLDAIRLVTSLLGWLRGERDRMHVVRVPSLETEDQRHLMRERGQLLKEIQQHRDRMRKLLATMGCWDRVDDDFAKRFRRGELVDYAGRALPAHLSARIERECARLELVEHQFKALEDRLQKVLPDNVNKRISQLASLKAVGPVGARRLVLELFWRDFDNRRQVAACVGLVPQPYDSGESRVDQGISKQGNGRLRALLVELSWLWLRYQPASALAQWFVRRTQGSGKRGRRVMIVAVARKLVIALWRYLEDGVIPEGAVLKG